MAALHSYSQVKLVDGADKSPVAYASVFNADGSLAGVTGADGLLPAKAGAKGALTVQHINYETKTFSPDTVSGGMVMLVPYTHKVAEVAVSAGKLEYLKMKAYVRRYHIGDSQPASFFEGICDFYLPIDGGKARVKLCSGRNLMRKDLKERYKSYFVFGNGLFPWRTESLLESFEKRGLLDKGNLRNAVSEGKRGLKYKVKVDAKSHTCELASDSLFSTKAFNFNFFGFKFRIENMGFGELYDTSAGYPSAKNLMRKNLYLDCAWRVDGKNNPEIHDEYFEEYYVLSMGYASKDAAKKASKDKTVEQFVRPDGIPPLAAPLAKAVEAMVPWK